jgi:hypothetical protein
MTTIDDTHRGGMKMQTKYLLIGIFLLAFCQTGIADEKAKSKDEVEVYGATLGRMGEPVSIDESNFHFSEAEARLWEDNHLANINRPGRLYYTFHKSGSYEKGFDDSVYLDILKVNDDGTKDTNLEFFTGARRQPANPANLEGIRGNPVLGIYMQGDVYEMNRLTHGSWRYFQRRIKTAFAKSAKVEQVTFKYHGSDVRGEKITIEPFVNDPHRSQMKQFANKTYEFILSQKIPGSIYQIKTVVPAKTKSDDKPLILEKLTFKRADFKS